MSLFVSSDRGDGCVTVCDTRERRPHPRQLPSQPVSQRPPRRASAILLLCQEGESTYSCRVCVKRSCVLVLEYLSVIEVYVL